MAYDASHLPPPSKKARHGSAVAASNQMSNADFRAMKAKLGRQRTAAVHSFCGEVAPGSSGQECAAWCLKSTGDPGPPPTSMVLWDRDRGGSTLVEPSSGAGFRGTTCFLEGDMISRAASLAAQGEGVVVLNMANRHRPGGGFLTAARAQEEQLCHRSDLFPRLKLLLRHANQYYYIWPGTAVLTPEVALRLQGKEGGFAPLDDPACVSVVSAAADQFRSEDAARRDPDLVERIEANWRAVLSACGRSGATVAVLSALGCGAFQNPPDVVGAALKRVLSEPLDFGKLEEVEVVILDDHNSRENVTRFRQGLGI